MPRKPDKKTGEMRGKPQKVTAASKKANAAKRYGKYALPRKKGEQLPPSQRTQPTWDEDRQCWVNKLGTRICGAPRTGRSYAGPGICCQPAGHGTNHLGYGQCKMHGGTLPEVANKAQVNRILDGATDHGRFWGAPINVTPEEAILQEIHRTQGHVSWLGIQLSNLPESDQHKTFGHYLIEKYQEERSHLIAVCKTALANNIAEKQVEIAQMQGKLLASVLQAFTLDPDLALTPAQRAKVPDLLRKHLTTIPLQAPTTNLPGELNA